MGEVVLTAPQAWALKMIGAGRASSPANLGYALMERPGYSGREPKYIKPQGAGRIGGAMMARLSRMGLCVTTGWPTRASLTAEGRRLVPPSPRMDRESDIP